MTSEQDVKYKDAGNSDSLSQKFHERAGDISKELYKQLLSLSTGVIAAFFLLVFNKRNELTFVDKVFILSTITLFGISMSCIILGMKWDASKYYFLGHINDSTKQNERENNETLKRKYGKRQIFFKDMAGIIFIFGILLAVCFLAFTLFIKQQV